MSLSVPGVLCVELAACFVMLLIGSICDASRKHMTLVPRPTALRVRPPHPVPPKRPAMVKLHFDGPPPNPPPRGGRAQESSPPPSWGRVRVGGTRRESEGKPRPAA